MKVLRSLDNARSSGGVGLHNIRPLFDLAAFLTRETRFSRVKQRQLTDYEK